MTNNILDLVAVVIQIIGSFFLFFSSPENKTDAALIFAANSDFNSIKQRNFRMRIGFLILCIGLMVQGFSVGLKFFNK